MLSFFLLFFICRLDPVLLYIHTSSTLIFFSIFLFNIHTIEECGVYITLSCCATCFDVRTYVTLLIVPSAITVLLLIFISCFPSCVVIGYFATCCVVSLFVFKFTVIFCCCSYLLISMTSVFIIFISSPYPWLLKCIFLTRFCKSFGFSPSSSGSSIYLRLLTVVPLMTNPIISQMLLNVSSLYKLNKQGDSTHLCLTVFLYQWTLNSQCLTAAVCFQYKWLITLMFFYCLN